ncbi:putative RING finger domain protein [Aspergillus puulaauensis]|uniref:RING finger domain protein n=1 Tax=Aspergillus puulaauensis TaxID=1220207 RepID=A0A7R7XEU6_9EURO|nr:uncharacterized protein APUU_12222A [Aspergillus puulaauensis]BCS19394.1 hypothetical protein APUU_12222A [Aspergillus puulaauensis]
MNSDSGVQFIARRRKRPRQEHSATHSTSTSTSRPTLPPLAMPPARYAGDGLDFRRPAAGPPVPPEEDSEVIDLTNEPDSPELPRRQIPESSRRQPRPPRFGREIMADVVNLEDEEEEQEPDPPSSPEVQFLSSTVRPPRPPPPARTQSLTASNFWRLLPLPQMFRSTNDPRYRREVPWRAASHLSRGDLETLWIGEDAGGPMDLTINLDNAEWELLGLPDIDRPERERPRSSYKAPTPAPEGFTRSLAEDDVATCPNCDEELGTGNDIKQQIWVAKQCGHVYCGECATNRSLTRAKKANAKTRPFAKCQVADCGKPVSAPKAMFQVYL